MNLKTITIAAIPLLFLLMGTATGITNQAKAWDGGGYPGPGPTGGLLNGLSSIFGGGGGGAFYAGQQDAVYDHDNGNNYNPVGQCLPCHSDDYWTSFHAGYNQQWNSYQAQNSEQKSNNNIYINGNNNYVSTNTEQSTNQEQQQNSFPTGPSGCGFRVCQEEGPCDSGCGNGGEGGPCGWSGCNGEGP